MGTTAPCEQCGNENVVESIRKMPDRVGSEGDSFVHRTCPDPACDSNDPHRPATPV